MTKKRISDVPPVDFLPAHGCGQFQRNSSETRLDCAESNRTSTDHQKITIKQNIKKHSNLKHNSPFRNPVQTISAESTDPT